MTNEEAVYIYEKMPECEYPLEGEIPTRKAKPKYKQAKRVKRLSRTKH